MSAHAVLAVHIAIIVFNLLGLIAIPLCARFGWSFVCARTWRVLHVLSWGVVALRRRQGVPAF
jgi:hypothetical protein